jgi:hypothetical protein
MQRLAAESPQVVVPGHGDVGGPQLLADVRDYLQLLRDETWVRRDSATSQETIVTEVSALMIERHPDWSGQEWISAGRRLLVRRARGLMGPKPWCPQHDRLGTVRTGTLRWSVERLCPGPVARSFVGRTEYGGSRDTLSAIPNHPCSAAMVVQRQGDVPLSRYLVSVVAVVAPPRRSNSCTAAPNWWKCSGLPKDPASRLCFPTRSRRCFQWSWSAKGLGGGSGLATPAGSRP